MAFFLPQQVVRRSGRIPKEIPIVLIGSDLTGKVFSEETKTVLLSLHGAGLLSRHKLSPEQEMVLRWPERNKEAEIRVVGQIGEDSGVYTYGVAFFDSVVNFWEMEFPPPTPKEQEFGHLTLVCNVCQTFERFDDQSIEADVVATNDGVLRYCKRCGNSTIWKVGQPGAIPAVPANVGAPSTAPSQPPTPVPLSPPQRVSSPPASFSELGPANPASFPGASQLESSTPAYSAASPSDLIAGGLPASASRISVTSPFRPAQPYTPPPGSSPSAGTSVLTLPAAEKPSEKSVSPAEKPLSPVQKSAQKSSAPGGINRRKYPRIRVNYIALVRHAERGEEFVQCEDVSRGGLRFKSTSRYMEQTLIEVAAPYSSGQAAIFVAARIVFVQELPEQNLFRYGVQYLSSDKPRGAF